VYLAWSASTSAPRRVLDAVVPTHGECRRRRARSARLGYRLVGRTEMVLSKMFVT
jgi:hypothetical protein